jgi:hypothetical protein
MLSPHISASCLKVQANVIYYTNMIHGPPKYAFSLSVNAGSKVTMYFLLLKGTNSTVRLLCYARLSETYKFSGAMKQVDSKYGIMEWDSFVRRGSTNLLSFISPTMNVCV